MTPEKSSDPSGAFHSNDATDRATNSIRAGLSTVGKDTYGRPCVVVAWVTRPTDDIRRLYFVKVEKDLDVREIGQALKRFRREPFGKSNAGYLAAPEVVLHLLAHRLDKADGLKL